MFKKILFPLVALFMLAGCAKPPTTIEVSPTITLPQQDPSLMGVTVSINGADQRTDQALAKVTRDNQIVTLTASRDLRFLLQEVLEKQMTARGYMVGPNGPVNLQIIVSQLYADVSQGNVRYNIATKADIAIIATAQNGNKMTKNYRASYNVEGAFQASNKNIADAVNSVLTDTIAATPGFFAAPAFPSAHGLSVKGPLPNIIKDQAQAQALTVDVEGRLDGTGYACLRSEAKWNREKIIPLYAKPLAAYVFEKAGAGFYRPGSLEDVSARMRVVAQDNRSMSVELDLGAPYAGKDVFLLAGHFFNALEIYEAQYADFQKTFDGFADAALDGAVNDEQGVMPVDAWGGEPFRGRYFSFAGERYWREALKTDFRRLLFDMRYAPAGDAAVRIRAINRYFDEARRVTMAFEDAVATRHTAS